MYRNNLRISDQHKLRHRDDCDSSLAAFLGLAIDYGREVNVMYKHATRASVSCLFCQEHIESCSHSALLSNSVTRPVDVAVMK